MEIVVASPIDGQLEPEHIVRSVRVDKEWISVQAGKISRCRRLPIVKGRLRGPAPKPSIGRGAIQEEEVEFAKKTILAATVDADRVARLNPKDIVSERDVSGAVLQPDRVAYRLVNRVVRDLLTIAAQ